MWVRVFLLSLLRADPLSPSRLRAHLWHLLAPETAVGSHRGHPAVPSFPCWHPSAPELLLGHAVPAVRVHPSGAGTFAEFVLHVQVWCVGVGVPACVRAASFVGMGQGEGGVHVNDTQLELAMKNLNRWSPPPPPTLLSLCPPPPWEQWFGPCFSLLQLYLPPTVQALGTAVPTSLANLVREAPCHRKGW